MFKCNLRIIVGPDNVTVTLKFFKSHWKETGLHSATHCLLPSAKNPFFCLQQSNGSVSQISGVVCNCTNVSLHSCVCDFGICKESMNSKKKNRIKLQTDNNFVCSAYWLCAMPYCKTTVHLNVYFYHCWLHS